MHGQNLVPNGSFEIYSNCPDGIGQIEKATGWFNPNGASPDYFNKCQNQILGCNVPLNGVGVQYPFEGNAYAGIYPFETTGYNASDYIQCRLLQKLKAGNKYCVEYYVSLAEGVSNVSMNKIGAYFSSSKISQTDYSRFHYIPQILNPETNSLFDTLNWVKISGEFTANGGEEYLTIGNFNFPEDDDTTYIGGGSPNSGNSRHCYFYIDNVSVVKCARENEVLIYPNPAVDYVGIDIPQNYNQAQLYIYSLAGQLLSKKQITSVNQQIPIPELSNGMYIFEVRDGDSIVGREKVIVSR